jgi:hypothetical protein
MSKTPKIHVTYIEYVVVSSTKVQYHMVSISGVFLLTIIEVVETHSINSSERKFTKKIYSLRYI